MVDTAESSKKESDDGASTSPLAKSISGAVILLYVLGWGAAFAWQNGWEPHVRASYGYQLGWVSGFLACASAILLRRAHQRTNEEAQGTQHEVLVAAAPATSEETV